MPVERSAGIIIFRNIPEGRRYLVLRSSRKESAIAKGKDVSEFWDFPKGRLEKGETGLDAARRETEEEMGLKQPRMIEGFKATVRYFTHRDGKAIPKFVAMFLAESPTDEVTLSWEHDRSDWLRYDEARRRLTLKPMQDALKAAEDFLKGRK